uniref:Putative ovule protein n=1 Tax=Solanum chacoense TaxID=4108 RepID=A0A0V0GU45_SOLCH
MIDLNNNAFLLRFQFWQLSFETFQVWRKQMCWQLCLPRLILSKYMCCHYHPLYEIRNKSRSNFTIK